MIDGPQISWLFETQALQVAPADSPFWYTSGLIGPYYINTHYLCGGAERAVELLEFIDSQAEERNSFPALMLEQLQSTYRDHEIFNGVIASLSEVVRTKLPEFSHVSGGQRRDWFFAPLVAEKLDKPCLYIYNDKSIIDQDGKAVESLDGAVCLNIADLLTVGSSYTDKWIPALANISASLSYSVNVVDRLQDGEANLTNAGVEKCLSLFETNAELFERALEQGYLSPEQVDLVQSYLRDPFASMQEFLRSNPDFLENALGASDQKTKQRAEKLVAGNLYHL